MNQFIFVFIILIRENTRKEKCNGISHLFLGSDISNEVKRTENYFS